MQEGLPAVRWRGILCMVIPGLLILLGIPQSWDGTTWYPIATVRASSGTPASSTSHAASSASSKCIECVPTAVDSAGPRKHWVDVTVGTTYGFPAKLVGKYGDDTELIPTTSALFMAEYALFSRFRLAALYDLTVTTEKKIIGGVTVEEPLPSRVALGVVWAPFRFDFAKTSRMELQGYGFMGMTIEKKPRPVPIALGRIHLMQDKSKGVGVYLGTSYQFVLNKVAVLYGVGYRF
jgi:hypothetical protein